MKDFAALSEHQTSDSTFLVLMSHGTLHGICGTMHSEKTPDVLQYDTIYQIFNNCHCPGLRDKPKVIIVQACRGGKFFGGTTNSHAAGYAGAGRVMPHGLCV